MAKKLSCLDEALRRLSYRLYSTKELRNYLSKKEYEQREINQTIEKLMQKKHLDDKKYVEGFVTGRAERRLMSIKGVVYELNNIVGNEPWIEERVNALYKEYLGGEDAVIKKRVIKRLKGRKVCDLDFKERKKLIGYLTNKGFNYYTVENVLDNLNNS